MTPAVDRLRRCMQQLEARLALGDHSPPVFELLLDLEDEARAVREWFERR